MGYTHYWTDNGRRQAISEAALLIINQLAQRAYQDGIIQRECDDDRPPLITAKLIRFNGVGEQGHETFYFDAQASDPWACCKTALKPYDDLVMRVLLVLAYHWPGMELRSDGAFDHEWIEALDWFNQNVGRAYIVDHLRFELPRSGQIGLGKPSKTSFISF